MAYQLSFSCNENWEMMKLNPTGKYCDKCSRNIYDLRSKTPEEILKLYKENNGKLCGKIRGSQLYKYQKKKLAKFCLALFLVFGFSIFTLKTTAQTDSTNIAEKNNTLTDSITIKGTVRDKETKETIPFLPISFKNNEKKISTMSDFDGNYVLNIPKTEIATKKIEIFYNYLGDEGVFVYTLDKDDFLNFYLKIDLDIEIKEIEFLGMIIPYDPSNIIDPDNHRSTTIKSDDIKRSPR